VFLVSVVSHREEFIQCIALHQHCNDPAIASENPMIVKYLTREKSIQVTSVRSEAEPRVTSGVLTSLK
jgi:hypothetical protein